MEAFFRDAKAVFFDMDNTLYDFEGSMRVAFEDLHARFPEPLGAYEVDAIEEAYWRFYHEFPYEEKWRIITSDPARYRLLMWTGALQALGLENDDAQASAITDAFAAARPLHLRRAVYSGAFETIGDLRKRHTVGVITNGPQLVQRPKLEAFEYLKHFTEQLVFVSGEFGVAKPDPSIFLAAARAAGVGPEACVMVGDAREYDMPAKAVGFRTILFDGKRACPDCSADEFPPDAVVSSYEELKRLF